MWNAWRRQDPSILPNLAGIVLTLGERQMGSVNGGPINLSFARLRQACLRFATLTSANLEGADVSDADLSDARLEDANLSGADLSDAFLDRADLAGAGLAGANLCGTSLLGARNLTQEQIEEADGDAFTVLPDHLSRPQAWISARVVKGSRGPREAEIAGPRPVAAPLPSTSGRHNGDSQGHERPAASRSKFRQRVSWLVGGPRSAARRSDSSVGDLGGV